MIRKFCEAFGFREEEVTPLLERKIVKSEDLEKIKKQYFMQFDRTDQQKIFKTTGSRRIVLSTNVAETSLTVPGIK